MSLQILHPVAQIVRAVLIALGAGSDGGDGTSAPPADWPVYYSGEPGNGDRIVSVRGTTPQSDGRDMASGETDYHYGLQVRVRAADDAAAGAKALELVRTLGEVAGENRVTLDAATYAVYNFAKIGGPLYIGKGAPTDKRSSYTINCTVALRRVA